MTDKIHDNTWLVYCAPHLISSLGPSLKAPNPTTRVSAHGRIARNSGHFEPVSNRQRYSTLSFEMSRSNMAAFAARR